LKVITGWQKKKQKLTGKLKAGEAQPSASRNQSGYRTWGTSIDTQRKRIKVDGVSYTKAQAADLR